MKAIVQNKYGSADELTLQEVEKPVAKDNEVLLRVRAASVHADVWHVMTGLPYVLRLMGSGLRKPKNPIPGTDAAGIVESVGKRVTRFRPGEEVFGETLPTGMQWTNGGAYAEYATAVESALAHKPSNVTFEQAAAVPTSGLIALFNLRIGGIRAGQKVVINGAGGGVGSIALQLAKALGTEVTGVDSAEKMGLLRTLGANHVIDYGRADFTQGDELYDLIFDIPGNHSFSECRRVLTPHGTYVLIGHDHYGQGMHRWLGQLPRMFKLMAMSMFFRQLPKPNFSMPDRREPMALLKELLETGKLTPHIDRTFQLSEIPDAIHYMQAGHAKGKIVVTV